MAAWAFRSRHILPALMGAIYFLRHHTKLGCAELAEARSREVRWSLSEVCFQYQSCSHKISCRVCCWLGR